MACCAAPPIEWPQRAGPKSRVIKDPSAWQDRALLVPHEAFRWLHSELRTALHNTDPSVPGQEWQGKALFQWLRKYYLVGIHHHHDSEEKVYNPWLESRGAVLPPKITSDHRQLLAAIEACDGFEAGVLSGDAKAVQGLKKHLVAMMADMEAHFDEEEAYYPQALRELGISEEDEAECVGKIVQSLGLEGNKVLLPPIVYAMHAWGGPDVVEVFKSKVPPPVRMMLDNMWVHDFYRNNLSVLRELQGQTEHSGTRGEGCNCAVM